MNVTKLRKPIMNLNRCSILLLIGLSVAVTGCGGGSGGGSTSPPAASTNSPPRITGVTDFSITENQQVQFQVTGFDSNGDTIIYSLEAAGDAAFFTIDSSTGGISANASDMTFDFESPQDSNEDNVYEFDVKLSDGRANTTTAITMSVQNEIEPATCSSGETVNFEENSTGPLYQFEAIDPDGSLEMVYQNFEVRREGNHGFSRHFSDAINFDVSTGELSLTSPIDAEKEGTEFAFNVTAAAKFGSKFSSCDVTLNLIDIPGRVTAGLKVLQRQESSSPIGDIDNDGRDEIWIESPTIESGVPDQPGGYLLYGSTVNLELGNDSAGTLNLDALNPSQAVHIFAEFPTVGDAESDGTRLIGSQLDDVDGDGVSELLLGLRPKLGSSDEATTATRPFAYLLWGNTLNGQSDGEIDLNNLSPSDGIILNGLDGVERSNLSIGSGDFDGDGIPDIIIGVPLMLDSRDSNDFSRGHVYIVFGKTLQEAAMSGQFELAEMEPSEGISIFDSGTSTWEYVGSDVSSLGDIDGDGADELVIVQSNRGFGVMHSSLFRDNASGQVRLKNVDFTSRLLNVFGHSDNKMSAKKGDTDGDGLSDLLISGRDSQFGLAALFPAASVLTSDYSNGIILTPYQRNQIPYVTFVNTEHYPYINKSSSFIGDLDGDGLDDFAIAGKELDEDAVVYVFLSKTFNITNESIIYNLDNIEAGEGLRMTGPYIGASVTGIDDMDGDGLPELYVSTDVYASNTGIFAERYGKSGYLIPGSDLIEAINSGVIDFDLDARFNDETR